MHIDNLCFFNLPIEVHWTVVLNQGASAHKGAVRKCQGSRMLSFLLMFRPILASRGAAKYWFSWPWVPRVKKGWETLALKNVDWGKLQEEMKVWIKMTLIIRPLQKILHDNKKLGSISFFRLHKSCLNSKCLLNWPASLIL